MKTLLLAAALLLGPAIGIIAPRTGADLGARGQVVVNGYGATTPGVATISVDMRLHRLLKAENRVPFFMNFVLFDWQRPFNKSYIVLSIPGTGYEQRFEIAWQPQAFPLFPFDGTVDFAGPSGHAQTFDKIVRIIEVIPAEHLALFAGDTVTLDWYYDSETSIQGAGITATVDEHMDPARAQTHFQP
jgi:hypothetical protein